MIIILFVAVLWYGGLFFQSFFLHRYAAHQVFTMSKTMERITFVLTWIFQGSSYLSAYGYGIMHRMHHAYTDTEKDPHSPSFDDNVFAMMWKTKTIYQDINQQRIAVDDRFTKNVPQWKAFDSFASSRFSRLLWISLYILFFALFVTSWWQWLLLPITFLMAPIHGVIINWFGHIYGYVNFKMKNTSKNLFRFDFLMMGEGYHNNHHKYASRANFGYKWYEIDVTYVIIKILDAFGVIQLKPIRVKNKYFLITVKFIAKKSPSLLMGFYFKLELYVLNNFYVYYVLFFFTFLKSNSTSAPSQISSTNHHKYTSRTNIGYKR